MRLLLVLLALISGLSLSDVGHAASRTEVVGAAARTPGPLAQAPAACRGEAKVARPTDRTRLANALPLPPVTRVRGCAIRLPDRPRE